MLCGTGLWKRLDKTKFKSHDNDGLARVGCGGMRKIIGNANSGNA